VKAYREVARFYPREQRARFDEWVASLSADVRVWLSYVMTADALSVDARAVALVLADHMNAALIASVPMRELTRRAVLTSDTETRAAVSELVRYSYLERRFHPGRTNEYAAMRCGSRLDDDSPWRRVQARNEEPGYREWLYANSVQGARHDSGSADGGLRPAA
jgi:hypothetical protein